MRILLTMFAALALGACATTGSGPGGKPTRCEQLTQVARDADSAVEVAQFALVAAEISGDSTAINVATKAFDAATAAAKAADRLASLACAPLPG